MLVEVVRASLPSESETSQLLTNLAGLIDETSRANDLGAFRRALLVGIERLPHVVYAIARRVGSDEDLGHFVGLDDATVARVRRAWPAAEDALAVLCAKSKPPTSVIEHDVAALARSGDAFATQVLEPLGAPFALVGAASGGEDAGVALVVGTECTSGSKQRRVINAIAPLLWSGESRFASAPLPRRAPPPTTESALTPAERDLVRYVALGFTNREIASARGTSPNTIKNQLKSTFQKVGAANRPELVQIAHEMGLLSSSGVADE
jgi:DNA-binding CsgD family transcriptional regulator